MEAFKGGLRSAVDKTHYELIDDDEDDIFVTCLRLKHITDRFKTVQTAMLKNLKN